MRLRFQPLEWMAMAWCGVLIFFAILSTLALVSPDAAMWVIEFVESLR